MIKLSEFLKFLIQINPASHPERLSFLNFLTNLENGDGYLTPDLVSRFFRYSLDYPHWLQNKVRLTQEVRTVLHAYCRETDAFFDFESVDWSQDMQVIELESVKSWVDVVQTYIYSHHPKIEKFRIVQDDVYKRILAFMISPLGTVEVQSFDRKFIVNQGSLSPLKNDQIVHFNSQLNVIPNQTMCLDMAQFVTSQFSFSEGLYSGVMTRGYLHQKLIDLKPQPLEAFPKLFYLLKRIEQFLVDRKTDPYYQALLQDLEKTQHQIKLKDPQGLDRYLDVLAIATTALENIYKGDRLLELQIKDFQTTLQKSEVQMELLENHKRQVNSKSGELSWIESENPWIKFAKEQSLKKPLRPDSTKSSQTAVFAAEEPPTNTLRKAEFLSTASAFTN
jgi:hypothetical protein